MKDKDKDKEQLVAELAKMRQQIADMQGRLRSLEATEIAHQDTEAQLQRRVQEMTVLNLVTNLTASAKDMAEALHHVCAELACFLQVSQAGFAILNSERNAAEVVADYHPPGSHSAIGVVIPVDGNPSMAYLLEHKVPLVVAEAQDDPLLAPVHDVMRQRNVQSILLAPILVEGEVIGTLGFDAFQRRVFSQADIELVQHVSNQVGPLLMWKQAESQRDAMLEALRESEARYRILFEQANDAIHLESENDEIIDVNQRTCEMMGYSRKELLTMRVPDLQASEVRKEAGSIIKGELTRYGNATFEALNVHRDGTLIPVEVSVAKIQGLKGDVYISIVRDISERKWAESQMDAALEALRESEARFRALSDATFEGITFTEQGVIVDANQQFANILGYEMNEIRGMDVSKFVAQEDQELVRSNILAGREQAYAHRAVRQDGTVIYVEVRPRMMSIKGRLMRVTAVRDVTERKRADEALRQLNRNLFLLNQVGQELVTTLDQFKITEQLLHVVTEVVGAQESSIWLWEKEQPSLLYLQEDAAHSQEDAAQNWLVCRAASPHAQGGSPLNLRVRPNQGVVGWVAQNEKSAVVSSASDDARFFPGIDEQSGFRTLSLLAVPLRVRGRVIGVLEAVNKLDGGLVPGQGGFDETDITLLETLAASAAIAIDNADLVETLQGRTTELQERNEDLDAYAHTVAHDLKGPLAYMIGFAQVLEQSYAELPAEGLRRHLRTISQSGRKMNNIIDELLLLARLREAEVASIPLDMASIVDEALARLAYMIEEHQAQIVLPESWPVALGYGPWVEEMWVNYLSNALSYGGRPPRLELGFDDSGQWVVNGGQWVVDGGQNTPTTEIRFWVRDNGPGLTPEEQERLFKSFERLDRVRARGHGLGLSIVRRIAEKLGGKVGVESELGQGSVFWFTLPGA